MRLESVAEQLFFVTCHIEARTSSATWTGTGFVYIVPHPAGDLPFIITNRHVFEDATSITIRFPRKVLDNEGGVILGRATQTTITDFSEGVWLGHPELEVDIAALPLGVILDNMTYRDAAPLYRGVPTSQCLGVGVNLELDAIENLTFIGYPNGLFDPASFLPILRRGITATPITLNYQNRPCFLMDAPVFPGSSGSPVFLLDRGIYTNRDGGTVVGSRIALVGIVAAVHTRNVNGEIVMTTTGMAAQFQEPLGLGIVYKATAIDEVAQLFLDRAGLERTRLNPPASPNLIKPINAVI